MRITTNKMEAEFDTGAINRDFVFLRFQRQDKQKNWHGAPLLDRLLRDGFNATAVLYRYSAYAYVMFKRPVDTHALLERIRGHSAFREFEDGAVEPCTACASIDEADGAVCGAWLLQILFNSLASSRSEKYPELNFSNLTGSLVLMENTGRRTADSLQGAEIIVTNGFLLRIPMRRYRKRAAVLHERKHVTDEKRRKTLENILERPQYAVHGGRGVLRRVFGDEPESNDNTKLYIRCGEYRKRAAVPFLDFSGRERFAASRAGIYQRFLERVRDELAGYLKITLFPKEPCEVRAFSGWKMNRPGYLDELADGASFQITDRIRNAASGKLAGDLKKMLSAECPETPLSEGTEDRPDALNFRIVHNAAWYEEHGERDEYLPFDGGTVRQHLTLEDMLDEKENLSLPAVRTIIKEALIKRDLQRGRITLFDWTALRFPDEWIFGIAGETRGMGKKREVLDARFMIVKPDGAFEMMRVPAGLGLGDEYQRYILTIQEALATDWTKDRVFEGLVARNGSINCIYRSEEITLPDLDGIARILDETGDELPEGKRIGSELTALLVEFQKGITLPTDGKHAERIESLKRALLERSGEIKNKNDLRRNINEHLGKTGRLAQSFRRHLLEKHGIRLVFSRGRENVERLLPALCDIKYFEENENKACYFAGEKGQGMKRKIKSACHIREVEAIEGSDLILRDILPTMDVDFVRTGQSTVVPFVFKYLRDCIIGYDWCG